MTMINNDTRRRIVDPALIEILREDREGEERRKANAAEAARMLYGAKPPA